MCIHKSIARKSKDVHIINQRNHFFFFFSFLSFRIKLFQQNHKLMLFSCEIERLSHHLWMKQTIKQRRRKTGLEMPSQYNKCENFFLKWRKKERKKNKSFYICTNLLFRFNWFSLTFSLFANRLTAPQFFAHHSIAYDHNDHWNAVCQHQKHNVISEE